MNRRSEGDAMPGWSTILRVDKAELGLDEEDEGTLHDGDGTAAPTGPLVSAVAADEPTPFDETTEPPAFEPASPGRTPAPAPSRPRPPPAAPSTTGARPGGAGGRPSAGPGRSAGLPAARGSADLPASARSADVGSGAPRFADPATGTRRALPLDELPIESLSGDEFTQLDQPAPEQLRSAASRLIIAGDGIGPSATPPSETAGDSTLLDTPMPDFASPRASQSVQVAGVVGERLPAVVVRRAPPAPGESRVSPAPDGRRSAAPPEARRSVPPQGGDRLLENAPVARTAASPDQRPATHTAELTQINAAAALGIAPEPAAPPAGLTPRFDAEADDKTPPPAIGRVDFGPLKLAEKEEILARYPVEAPGIGAAERLGERAPAIAAMSKILPLVFTAMLALSFVGVFLIGPLGDLLQAGDRQSARDALRVAQERELAAQASGGTSELPSGSIRVVTQPTRAAIEVDGYYLGRSPIMIAPPEERPLYRFRISATGHKTWEGEIHAAQGGYVLRGPGSIAPDGAHHRLLVTLEPDP